MSTVTRRVGKYRYNEISWYFLSRYSTTLYDRKTVSNTYIYRGACSITVSQYIISPDSHPSQLQSGFKYSQVPDIQCVQNKTNNTNRITSCFMSKMKQLFKGYHNNKSDGRFFVVFVVITPVSSAGAKKKKKSQNRQVWTPFPLTRVKTDISSSVRLHNTSLCEQLRESQYGASLSVCWFEIERQFEDVFVRVCVSALNSWEMFNKQKKKTRREAQWWV